MGSLMTVHAQQRCQANKNFVRIHFLSNVSSNFCFVLLAASNETN
jgi:hypothetical protein